MSRDSFSYTHGDTGTAPSSSIDFVDNQRPDPQSFDWFWNKVINAINGHASEFDRLDSNDDGVVDEADAAGAASGNFNVNDNLIYNVDSLRDSAANLELVFSSANDRFEFEDGSGNRTEGLFSRVYLENGAGWFDGDHNQLQGVGSSDHHSRYSDSEARTAVEGTSNVEDLASAGASGTVPTSQGDGTIQMESVSVPSSTGNNTLSVPEKKYGTVGYDGTEMIGPIWVNALKLVANSQEYPKITYHFSDGSTLYQETYDGTQSDSLGSMKLLIKAVPEDSTGGGTVYFNTPKPTAHDHPI